MWSADFVLEFEQPDNYTSSSFSAHFCGRSFTRRASKCVRLMRNFNYDNYPEHAAKSVRSKRTGDRDFFSVYFAFAFALLLFAIGVRAVEGGHGSPRLRSFRKSKAREPTETGLGLSGIFGQSPDTLIYQFRSFYTHYLHSIRAKTVYCSGN